MTLDSTKTSDWYIFEPIFMVRVPAEALRTENEVRVLGTHTTFNKRVDATLSRAMTTVYLNIARMADLFANGHPVSVVNHADCKTIFEYTQNHLDTWAKLLQGTVNRPHAPFDDLQKLDQFAASVFNHARHQYANPENMQSGFMRAIESLGLLGEFSVFQPSLLQTQKAQAALNQTPLDAPKREPLSELFLRAQAGA